MRALLLLALWPALAAGQPVNVDDVVEVYVLRDGRKIGIEETTEPPYAAPPVVEARRPAAAARSAPPVVEARRAVAPAPVVVRRVPTAPAPEVARAPSFPGRGLSPGLPPAHEGHSCPRCGHTSAPNTGTWLKRGTTPDGAHVHRCPVCATTWRHF